MNDNSLLPRGYTSQPEPCFSIVLRCPSRNDRVLFLELRRHKKETNFVVNERSRLEASTIMPAFVHNVYTVWLAGRNSDSSISQSMVKDTL